MIVKEATDAARQWVETEGSRLPGFCGAYLAGSVNWLPDDAVISATSDVDIMVVLEDSIPPIKPGKMIYRGALIEVSYVSRDRLRSAEQVLGDYHLAGAFRTPNVLAEPLGQLTALQANVAKEYPSRVWVHRRCEHAADTARTWARAVAETMQLHDQVTVTVFA